MKQRRTFRKEHIGHPIDFQAFDGRTYNGNLIAILKRGIRIRYYVPQVMRECESCLPTPDAKRRVSVL